MQSPPPIEPFKSRSRIGRLALIFMLIVVFLWLAILFAVLVALQNPHMTWVILAFTAPVVAVLPKLHVHALVTLRAISLEGPVAVWRGVLNDVAMKTETHSSPRFSTRTTWSRFVIAMTDPFRRMMEVNTLAWVDRNSQPGDRVVLQLYGTRGRIMAVMRNERTNWAVAVMLNLADEDSPREHVPTIGAHHSDRPQRDASLPAHGQLPSWLTAQALAAVVRRRRRAFWIAWSIYPAGMVLMFALAGASEDNADAIINTHFAPIFIGMFLVMALGFHSAYRLGRLTTMWRLAAAQIHPDRELSATVISRHRIHLPRLLFPLAGVAYRIRTEPYARDYTIRIETGRDPRLGIGERVLLRSYASTESWQLGQMRAEGRGLVVPVWIDAGRKPANRSRGRT